MESTLKIMSRGNQKIFIQYSDRAVKVLCNKEEKNSHTFHLHKWVCHLVPNMRHTAHGMRMKDRKGSEVWDGFTKFKPLDILMNDYTSIGNEPEVTFWTAKTDFYWLIYNSRASYPEAPILLDLADIKACFRFPRIHPGLTGACGFPAANLYF